MDDAITFYEQLRGRLEQPKARLALAQIVKHRGSTPRKTGARLLIDPSGESLGTVGGGCGEAQVSSRAQRVLVTGQSELVRVSLLEEDGWESDAICGGVMDVLIERIDETIGGHAASDFWRAWDTALSGGGTVLVATRLPQPEMDDQDGGAMLPVTGRPARSAEGGASGSPPASAPPGVKLVADATGHILLSSGDGIFDRRVSEYLQGRCEDSSSAGPFRSGLISGSSGDGEIFLEVVRQAPELVVVGAGHVGAALCGLGAAVGFRVVVLEDRESFAHPGRLPGAARIIVGDPRETLAGLAAREDRHVVLVTRGHRLDAGCLRVALGLPFATLGMIGSRRRVRRIREQLVAEGADPAALDRLHAPIGLEIGAETPAEIALAILAQIVAVRRGGRGR